MSQSDEVLCPMCMDELDETDLNFKPCTCGYQMCRFCWHHIKENVGGKCPHCRRPYNPENYIFVPPDPKELERKLKEKKMKQKEQKMKKLQEANMRKQLSNVRVIQKNLVYITNLSLNIAKEEILRKPEYFGKYGKILKIVVNKNNLYNADSPQGPSVSCYITYQRNEDSARAIQNINGSYLDGRPLRASFGTTKYCTYFLRNMTCTNPECMYLHELGEEKESFTKEEMATRKHILQNSVQQLLDRGKNSPSSVPNNVIKQEIELENENHPPVQEPIKQSSSSNSNGIKQNIPTVESIKVIPTVEPIKVESKPIKEVWKLGPPESVKKPPPNHEEISNIEPHLEIKNSEKPIAFEKTSALPPFVSWGSKTRLNEDHDSLLSQQKEEIVQPISKPDSKSFESSKFSDRKSSVTNDFSQSLPSSQESIEKIEEDVNNQENEEVLSPLDSVHSQKPSNELNIDLWSRSNPWTAKKEMNQNFNSWNTFGDLLVTKETKPDLPKENRETEEKHHPTWNESQKSPEQATREMSRFGFALESSTNPSHQPEPYNWFKSILPHVNIIFDSPKPSNELPPKNDDFPSDYFGFQDPAILGTGHSFHLPEWSSSTPNYHPNYLPMPPPGFNYPSFGYPTNSGKPVPPPPPGIETTRQKSETTYYPSFSNSFGYHNSFYNAESFHQTQPNGKELEEMMSQVNFCTNKPSQPISKQDSSFEFLKKDKIHSLEQEVEKAKREVQVLEDQLHRIQKS